MATDSDRTTIPELFYQSLRHVMNGDCAPMLELWSEQDDVAYIDPNGRHYRGRDELVAYWRRAAEQNGQAPGSISAQAEPLVVYGAETLLAAVMAEYIEVREHGQLIHLQAVSTNIYRREAGQWRMVHRHSGSTVEVAPGAESR